MNELRIFLVGMAGGLFIQSMNPVPPVAAPHDWASDILVRTLVSAAGGLLSTLVFKAIQRIPWNKRWQKRRKNK